MADLSVLSALCALARMSSQCQSLCLFQPS